MISCQTLIATNNKNIIYIYIYKTVAFVKHWIENLNSGLVDHISCVIHNYARDLNIWTKIVNCKLLILKF